MKEFFHPSEQKILSEILKCAELHRKIKRFIVHYASQAGVQQQSAETIEGEMPKGLYLQALADSLDASLDRFRTELVNLEKQHVQNPNLPISSFLTKIKVYETFFYFLLHFVNELKTQRLHGCAILVLLHKYNFHADPMVMQAIRLIRKGVYAIFLRQLSQWLIYGRLVDVHEEFFIVHRDSNKSRFNHSFENYYSAMATTVGTMAPIFETHSVNADLWQYQILYDLLPPNFPPSWAEKVLFIGQTVRMLNDDPRKTTKKLSIWNDDDQYTMEIGSLWNKQEDVYFNKIQTLNHCDSIDVSVYDQVVNEIKTYITERLSEIAFNQADLIKHLRLVKDYYLLGRGELFLEFIIQLESITAAPDTINEHLARDVNQAFQTALNRTCIDLEQITMHLPLDKPTDSMSEIDGDPMLFLRLLRLKFNVKWPLHLFFSPLILDRYNQLFRFLLQIRKLQNDLHNVWRLHREQKKAAISLNSQLRNRMLFLIDNLQYYLHVDVLESQFSILLNAVQHSKDFEFIQRTHSIFQANILSLCFLLNTSVGDAVNSVNTTMSGSLRHCTNENPVLTILNRIMKTIREFCLLNADCSDPLTHEEQQQLEFGEKL